MRAARFALHPLALLALLTARTAHADAPPRLVSSPEVEAPADVPIADGASVLLQVTVDAEGAVTDVTVVEGVRDDVDQRVTDAARQMRFTPAERGGVNVPSRVRFRFRLHAARASAPTTPPDTSATSAGASSTGAEGTTANPQQGAGATNAAGTTEPPVAPPENPYTAPVLRRRSRASGGADGITVRARFEPGAATRNSFRAEELTTVPGTFGEPTRIVASLPGVARSPFGLGFFVVRGASFENTGFFVDGYPILILYHVGAGPAVISSRLVGQMDFYPGGYPLQYGRFSAGVISLETRAPPADRPRLEFEVDFLRASLLGVTPFANGRGTVAVAFRRSYYDFLLPLLSPGVLLNYGDAQIRADYRLTDRLRASLFAFASVDSFDRSAAVGEGATAATSRDGLAYTFGRAIAKLDYRGENGLTAQWSAMMGYDETRIVQADPGQPDRGLRGSGAVLGQRASIRVPVSNVLTATAGVDMLGYIYNVNLAFPSTSGFGAVPAPGSNPRVNSIDSAVTQFDVTPYFEAVVRAGRLEVTSGSRLSYLAYQGNSHLIADPRGVARLRVHDRVTVIGATGLFHQAPPFFSLIPQAGNPNLLPQRAWQSSLGVESTLPFGIEARVTGFFNRMWQLPRASYGINDAVPTGNGASRAFAVSDGEGRAYGVELLVRRKLERGVYGWLSYTLSRSERFIGNGPVVPFTYDQTHVLNLAASWDIDHAWRVGARFQLATGSPTSFVNGAIYDADADGYRPQYVAEADRLPAYHQLDVRVDYRFRLGPWTMSAYLDVLNTYYAQNSEGWVYQYDYGDRRPRPGIPILPTLGIRGEL